MPEDPVWFGYNFPFMTPHSVLDPQADVRLIKNDLLQLFLTAQGDRVMRSGFGTIIRKLPFEPNDEQLKSRIANDIRSVVSLYDPRVVVKNIIIKAGPDQGIIIISVLFSLVRDPNIIFTIDLPYAIASGTVVRSTASTRGTNV